MRGLLVALVCLAAAATSAGCEAPAMLGAGCTFTSQCGEALVCAGARCRAECREDRDCPGSGDVCARFGGGGGVCTPPATAYPCRLHSDCGPGARCEGGGCRLECREDGDCESFGACVDETCTEPVLTPPESDAGVLPGECTGQRVRCPDMGACVDLRTDVTHCGSCDTDCPPNEDCRGGACYCDAPNTQCGTDCIDTDVDWRHCGGCSITCPTLEGCSAGHCCPPGDAWCDGACIPVYTDIANCGGCGVACAAGERCRDARCMAPEDTCDGALELTVAASTSEYVVSAERWADDANSCSSRVDGYFRFTLRERAIVSVFVEADDSLAEPEAGWVDASCSAAGVACGELCDGKTTRALLAVLDPGEHRFVVDVVVGASPPLLNVTLVTTPIPAGAWVQEVRTGTNTFASTLTSG